MYCKDNEYPGNFIIHRYCNLRKGNALHNDNALLLYCLFNEQAVPDPEQLWDAL